MTTRRTEVREPRPALRARINERFPRVPAALGAARWACDCGRLHVTGTGKAGLFDTVTYSIFDGEVTRFGLHCECGRTIACVEQDRGGGRPIVMTAYRPPEPDKPKVQRHRLTMLENPEIARQIEEALATAIRWMVEQEQPEDSDLNCYGFHRKLRVGGGKYQHITLTVAPKGLLNGHGIWVGASYAGTLALGQDQRHALTRIVNAAAWAAKAKGVQRTLSGEGYMCWELAARAHPSAIKKGGALVPPGWEQ